MDVEAPKNKRFSNITKTEIEWLWYPYIPFGKISVLQGDPGCGKSLLMMDIIAKVTRGEPLPDGRVHNPINVIYQCSEDGIEDTIKPRLERAGADCERVSCINEDIITLTLDDEMIRHAIIDLQVKLLVIDPFQAYIGDSVLSSATGMRRVMKKLGVWATAFNCAVILVGHLNKRLSQKELYRGLGSVDIMALARSVLQIDCSDKDDQIRHLTHVKSSLASPGRKLAFRVDSEGVLHWINDCEVENENDPKYLERYVEADTDNIGAKSETAVRIMINMLSSGPKKASEIIMSIQKQGISERTIKNAKKMIGIVSIRKMKTWYWSLPTPNEARQETESQHQESVIQIPGRELGASGEQSPKALTDKKPPDGLQLLMRSDFKHVIDTTRKNMKP